MIKAKETRLARIERLLARRFDQLTKNGLFDQSFAKKIIEYVGVNPHRVDIDDLSHSIDVYCNTIQAEPLAMGDSLYGDLWSERMKLKGQIQLVERPEFKQSDSYARHAAG